MTTARYIGGNHDPVYYRDLFATSQIGNFNRTHYSNPEYDEVITKAVNKTDCEKAKQLHAQAQQIISRDVPLIPLWYPANMIVASKAVGNIKTRTGSGDWFFVRNLTYNK
jgi:peptide/nickel transport system substrate-binding protein